MRPLLEVRDLEYRYPNGVTALRGVSFSVAPGERVALLGATGSGKSTLLLQLNGLLEPTAGRVVVDGLPATGPHVVAVRRRIGLVFQNPDDQLFLPTLIEDVAFGPLNEGADPATAGRRARAVLEQLGLAEAAHRAAHHLSGGEQRLAALATVLVGQPALLALDEPTGALDARGRRRLIELLRRRTEALLVATHDLEVAAALCDRALVLNDGQLVADRPLRRVLDDRRLLEVCGLVATHEVPGVSAEQTPL